MESFSPLKQPLRGAHSIEASAGTGKTYTIALLWLRLLLEEKVPIDQILISTFTRAATAELEERLLDNLRAARLAVDAIEAGEELKDDIHLIVANALKDRERNLSRELNLALSSFDLAPIHTIHGFCQNLLLRMSLEMGGDPDLELIENDEEYRNVIVEDLLMQDRDTGLVAAKKAHEIAKVASSELGVDEDRIGLPGGLRVEEDEYQAAKAYLKEQLPVDTKFSELSLRNSLKKSVRLVEEYSRGVVEDSFSATAQTNISAAFPELWKSIEIVKAYQGWKKSSFKCNLVKAIRYDLQDRKTQTGVRCFDDILIELKKALLAEGTEGIIGQAVRDRYRAVIIDECQDSDGVQIDVFRRLFLSDEKGKTKEPTSSMLVIGDPKQSIYRFRGADLASYGHLTESMKKAPEMKRNYRSDGALVNAINQLYKDKESFSGTEGSREISYIEVEAHGEASRIDDPSRDQSTYVIWSDGVERTHALKDISDQFAKECKRLLSEKVKIIDRSSGLWREIEASDVAVIALKHDHLTAARKALQSEGIPCQQAGKGLGKVIDSQEYHDLQAWLQAMEAVRLGDSRQLSRILTLAVTPFYGLGAKECLDLGIDPEHQSEIMTRLRKDASLMFHEGPMPVLTRMLNQDEHLERNLKYRDGERRLTNWKQLGMILQKDWASGLREPGQLSHSLARRKATGRDREEMMKLETDLPAVELVTLHGSKGLEYPIVFCPAMWWMASQTYRKSRAEAAVVRDPYGGWVDFGTDKFDERLRRQLEQEKEELDRLLYVALTRPRHRLYLGLAPVARGKKQDYNGAEDSPIAKLMGLGPDLESWKENLPWEMITPFAETDQPFLRNDEEETLILEAPPHVDPWRGAVFRTSSYSSITGAHENVIDHDESRNSDDRRMSKAQAGLLEGLGGGALLGNRVHDLLEQVMGNGRSVDSLFVDGDEEGETLKVALSTILTTPMTFPGYNGGVTLEALRSKSMTEMHFMLSLKEAGFSQEDLSQALLQDPGIQTDPEKRSWAESVQTWSFGKFRGFLQGFIDLVFEHEGRWWILDYKTNQLPGYGTLNLDRAMLESDYLLQARLYAVALHRHLQIHLDGYDFDKNFGGCIYLYLRGFPAEGVWAESLDKKGLLALSDLFSGESP